MRRRRHASGSRSTAANTSTEITDILPAGATGSRGAIISADGNRLYVADQSNDDIYIFDITAGTGALAANANSPIAFAAGNPERFTMSEDGLRIFCTFSGSVDQLVIIDDDATPTQATGSPVALTGGDDPVGLTIPPGTSRVYIALSGADVLVQAQGDVGGGLPAAPDWAVCRRACAGGGVDLWLLRVAHRLEAAPGSARASRRGRRGGRTVGYRPHGHRCLLLVCGQLAGHLLGDHHRT